MFGVKTERLTLKRCSKYWEVFLYFTFAVSSVIISIGRAICMICIFHGRFLNLQIEHVYNGN